MYITGADYESRPYSLPFRQGISKFPFKVPIIDDDIYEDTESFKITIDPSSLPSDVIVEYPSEVTVFVIDDDGKSVVQENTYTLNISVMR